MNLNSNFTMESLSFLIYIVLCCIILYISDFLEALVLKNLHFITLRLRKSLNYFRDLYSAAIYFFY